MELSTQTATMAPRPQPPSAPMPQPDLRLTADVAALNRDSQPDIALAIPPGQTQTGVISAAMIATSTLNPASATELPPDRTVNRLLKPYGIAMLPDTAQGAPVPQNGDDSNPPT